jgi:cell division protein FtsZ
VSVVATGIDVALSAHLPASTRNTVTPVIAAPTPAPQAIAAASRLAELTQSLRASTQRMAERPDRTDQAHRAVAQALSIPPAAETIEQPQAEIVAPVETLAPSITAIEDVTIRPIAPKPTLFVELADEQAEAAPPPAALEKPFIPPQAERPAVQRAPRMPRIDELPIPAQNQIRARQNETAAAPEKPRVSLLQRLASVGLGRREEEPVQPRQAPAPAQRMAPPMPKSQPMPPLARPQETREPVSEYAKRPAPQRPAPQGLDQHGRQAPVNNSLEDDQLEIPAFLRRQAN